MIGMVAGVGVGLLAIGNAFAAETGSALGFLRAQGHDIVTERGEKILLRGVGLGNWMLPEGWSNLCQSGPKVWSGTSKKPVDIGDMRLEFTGVRVPERVRQDFLSMRSKFSSHSGGSNRDWPCTVNFG